MDELYGENNVLSSVPQGMPAVTVENGTFVGQCNDGVLSFKGIPYAKPPVGELRWQEAQHVEPSNTIREALYFGKSAIQTKLKSEKASYYKQGEDCLTLNIWTSNTSKRSLRPVMVWIHGGSYGWGGASNPLFDMHNFVKEHPEVVLVSINYRLGIMGFLDLTRIKGGESYTSSANLGILDQVTALEWIQRNISEFGGNPELVTIFGESAGAGSVSLLSVMPRAKGLFRRAIAQSGSVAFTSNRDECELLIQRLRLATGAETLSDLMKLSEDDLMRLNEKLNMYNCFPLRDGTIIPADPFAAYANGNANHVDFLMGTNKDEARFWIGELGGLPIFKKALAIWYENILKQINKTERKAVEDFIASRKDETIWNITEFFNELMFRIPMLTMADSHSDCGGKTFVYYWAYPSALPHRGACHAVEIAYVLNNTHEQIHTGNNINTELAGEVQQMWVNFAVTGNPSTPSHLFLPYNTSVRPCMQIDNVITSKNDILASQRQLFSPLIPLHISPLYCNMSLNVPTMWRLAAYTIVPFTVAASIITALLYKKKKEK